MTNNVKNRFKQAGSGSDNDLLLDGQVTYGKDAVMTSIGDPSLSEVDYTARVREFVYDALVQPIWRIKSIDSTDSPYTLLATDDLVLCDCTSGNIVINLPALSAADVKEYNIKKMDVTANTITIDPNGSETIDGELTEEILSQYIVRRIIPCSTEWSII